MSNDKEYEMYTLPEPKIDLLDLKPVQSRGRGRPRKNQSAQPSRPRPLSAYNLFVQEQMLAGAFSELSGQDRMSEISKMFSQTKQKD